MGEAARVLEEAVKQLRAAPADEGMARRVDEAVQSLRANLPAPPAAGVPDA